jgi:hypothetical protein
MKKTIIIGLIALLSVFLTYGLSNAIVHGPCYMCHTMHNSQNGAVVFAGGPAVHLLNNTCLGCHTTTGTDPLLSGYPYVQMAIGAGTDTNSLAGGFFNPGDDGLANAGMSHSLGLAGADPPGNAGTTYRDTAYVNTGGLTCAGTSGCHGVSSVADPNVAISGGHHGSSTAMGYRMLVAKGPTKVRGTGASDYEKALIAAPDITDLHNIYDASATVGTISDLCATCHGDFHGTVGSAGAWTRHPTDVAIPSDWAIYTGFAANWTNNAIAWKQHPLGFVGLTETAANSRVTCLSCHRAHGTAHADLLRWDYDLMQAGSTTVTYGCLGCHNKQRG